MSVFAITGMVAEARIARRAGLGALVIGGAPARKSAMLERAIADGGTGLVSFGIAGALDPNLAPGTILLPAAVRTEEGTIQRCDEAWREATRRAPSLRFRGDDGNGVSVLGESKIVTTARQKHDLFVATGAVAVDLESSFAARAAAQAGIPFIVLRAIADPATRDLPPAALVGLDDEGRPALGAVLASLATRPGQLPALIRLARETQLALRALALVASAILPSVPA